VKGDTEGACVGVAQVGAFVGLCEGDLLGATEGAKGAFVGAREGLFVGDVGDPVSGVKSTFSKKLLNWWEEPQDPGS
jgi:hypothetical protein